MVWGELLPQPIAGRVAPRAHVPWASGLYGHQRTIVKGAQPGEPWDEIEILIMRMCGARAGAALAQKV